MTSCLLTWRTKSSPMGVTLKGKKNNAPMGGNLSFLYEMTPLYMRGNDENERVASPESVSSYLKYLF